MLQEPHKLQLYPKPLPGRADTAQTKASWQEQWEKTVSSAKREGNLVIYTSIGGDARVALIKAFKEDFGIDVEWTVARADSIAEFVKADAPIARSTPVEGSGTSPTYHNQVEIALLHSQRQNKGE